MRANWSGFIRFGLINIPIKLYNASVEEKQVGFRLLHQKDHSPIYYKRICEKEEKVIPYEDIVTGFEYAKNTYVVIDEKDLEHVHKDRTRTIQIFSFAKQEEIDPMYIDKPHFLEPGARAAVGYSLIRDSLQKAHRIAIGKYIFRNKEHLIMLRTEKEALLLNHLRYADEVIRPASLHIPKIEIQEKDVAIGVAFIQQMTKPFRATQYRDTYKEELLHMIQEKVKGKEQKITKKQKPKPTKNEELIPLLEKSLHREKIQ